VRSGTTAAKLDGRNPPAAIAARARRLRAAGERKRAAFARRFDGAEAEVLVETTRDPASGALRGYTRNYLRARLNGPDAWRGRRLRARLAVGRAGQVTAAVGAEELARARPSRSTSATASSAPICWRSSSRYAPSWCVSITNLTMS